MSDGNKQKLLAGLAAMNFVTVCFVMFRYFSTTDGFGDFGTLILNIAMGAAIGLVVGAIAYALTPN
ncbi:MAG: hypothetical protein U0894_02565 [Pirellulales bacterium]